LLLSYHWNTKTYFWNTLLCFYKLACLGCQRPRSASRSYASASEVGAWTDSFEGGEVASSTPVAVPLPFPTHLPWNIQYSER